MTEKNIGLELKRNRAEMVRLVAEMTARIMACPDNPRAKRLGPNCVVVRFSDLSAPNAAENASGKKKVRASSWSPEYHDFKKQCEYVVKAVDAASIDRAMDVVAEAAETGVLRIPGCVSWTMRLHPDVVAHLKEVLR